MMARFYQPPSSSSLPSSSAGINIDTGTTRNGSSINNIIPSTPPLMFRSTLFSTVDKSNNDSTLNGSASFLNQQQSASNDALTLSLKPPSSAVLQQHAAEKVSNFTNKNHNDASSLPNGNNSVTTDENPNLNDPAALEAAEAVVPPPTEAENAVKNRQISPLQLAKTVRFRVAPDISMRVTNMCCNFNLRCHINLLQLAEHGENVVYKRAKGQVEMRLKMPPLLANISSSGKVVCFGWACTEFELIRNARRVARLVHKLEPRVKFSNFRVNNTGATAALPNRVDLRRFSVDERFRKNFIYEPEIHPGAEYRAAPQNPSLVGMIQVFQTGAIRLKAPLLTDCIALLRHFTPIAEMFYVKSPPPVMPPTSNSSLNAQQYQQQQMRASRPNMPYHISDLVKSPAVVTAAGPSRIISSVVLSNGLPLTVTQLAARLPSSHNQAAATAPKIISSTSGNHKFFPPNLAQHATSTKSVPTQSISSNNGRNRSLNEPPSKMLRKATPADDDDADVLVVDEDDDDDDDDYDDEDEDEDEECELVLYGDSGTQLLNDVVLSALKSAETTTSSSAADNQEV